MFHFLHNLVGLFFKGSQGQTDLLGNLGQPMSQFRGSVICQIDVSFYKTFHKLFILGQVPRPSLKSLSQIRKLKCLSTPPPYTIPTTSHHHHIPPPPAPTPKYQVFYKEVQIIYIKDNFPSIICHPKADKNSQHSPRFLQVVVLKLTRSFPEISCYLPRLLQVVEPFVIKMEQVNLG